MPLWIERLGAFGRRLAAECLFDDEKVFWSVPRMTPSIEPFTNTSLSYPVTASLNYVAVVSSFWRK